MDVPKTIIKILTLYLYSLRKHVIFDVGTLLRLNTFLFSDEQPTAFGQVVQLKCLT